MKMEENKETKAVIIKMAKYCAYQDRCRKEVYNKLYDLLPDIVEQDIVVDYLIKENYLDEVRYTRSIVRGKFFHKHWGKIKIIHFLNQKDIDSYLTEQTIANEITNQDYYQKVADLVKSRFQTTKGANDFEIKQKIIKSLFQKGYDSSIVIEVIDDLQED